MATATQSNLTDVCEAVDLNDGFGWHTNIQTKCLIQALSFVTDDRYLGHGQCAYWQRHADIMQEFFDDTNDGQSQDWDWTEVIPYWDTEDLCCALEDWEAAGCPFDREQDQAYADLTRKS